MTHPNPAPNLDLLMEVHRLCCGFEDEWKEDRRPHIEDYLPRISESHREQLLLALLRSDLELRTDRSEQPNREEYRSRFSEFASSIDLAFDELPSQQMPIDSDHEANRFRIAHYSIINEIDRGGMGVVYQAVDERVGRTVALKVILSGQLASAAENQRFEIEARAVAMLDHPGIVPVFEVGKWAGHRYLAMPLVVGSNLADVIRPGPIPARQAAKLIRQIAEAMQFAHNAGIIHRDLKPKNILLDESGRTRITDFGLAKIVQQSWVPGASFSDPSSSKGQITVTGQILGSPNYMSPEQAAGESNRIGPSTDIYSLGAVLYEMLTGEPPFRATTILETLEKIKVATPALIWLKPATPRDLATICLKCLEKDPLRRYASASDLVEDLNRFLSGRPVQARRTGMLGHFWRWSKRNPVVAGMLASIAMVVTCSLVTLTAMNTQIRHQTRETSGALQHEQVAKRERNAALISARASETLARRRAYAARMMLAGHAWAAGETTRAAVLLESVSPSESDAEFRGFEWHFLHSQLFGGRISEFSCERGEISSLNFSPDGTRIAITGGDQDLGYCEVWDLDGPRRIARHSENHSIIQNGAFSPDGRQIAFGTGIGELMLADANSLREIFKDPIGVTIQSLAWSPAGHWIAAGLEDGGMYVWKRPGMEKHAIEHAHGGPVLRLHAPSDNLLFSAADWGTEGNVTHMWNMSQWPPQRIEGFANQSICDSQHGGDRLLGVHEGTVVITNAHDKKVQVDRTVSMGSLVSPRYSPDGKSVFVATRIDRGIMRLSSENLELEKAYPHQAALSALAVNDRRNVFASGDAKGNVYVWNLDSSSPRTQLKLEKPVEFVGTLPGCDQIVLGGDFNSLLWRPATATMSPYASIRGLRAISQDGQWLVSLSTGADTTAADNIGPLTINVHQAGKEQAVHQLRSNELDWADRIAISATGKWLAISSLKHPLRICSLKSAEPKLELVQGSLGVCHNCRFTSDEKTLVTAEQYGCVRCIDLDTMSYQANLNEFQSYWAWAYCVEFSQDEKLVGVGNETGIVRIWDTKSRHLISTLKNSPGVVNCIAFFPDRRRIAVGDPSGVRLWDLLTGDELLSLPLKDDHVLSIVVNETGDQLVARSEKGIALAWKAN